MINIAQFTVKLSKIAVDLSKIIKKERLTTQDKKHIVELFIQIDSLKKSIVSIIFNQKSKNVGARARILKYFQEDTGQVVSGRELAQVGGISEYARRIRELRHEHGGWQISTGMNRADLRPDQYVLESMTQKPVYERMNAKVWAAVLKRDNFTCQMCGWQKADPQTNSRRFLEVHHKNPVEARGKAEPNNLITLCNVCHDSQS